MIRSVALFAGAFLCAWSAQAELFKANFQAPDNKGRPRSYAIEVDLVQDASNAISGEIKTIHGTSACMWAGIKVAGGPTADGGVRWASEENPLKGCGRVVFVGKKEGNHWVGQLPRFQGAKIDLVLEPAQ
jgi:hypothetical protein